MKTHDKQFSEFLTEYRKDGFRHKTYGKIFEAMKDGDVETIEHFDWEVIAREGIGKMSENSVMQAKYLLIVSCTLASAIAMNEGVESELSLSLTDYYIQFADKIMNVKELTQLTKNVMVHFCSVIKRQKNIPYSKSVKKIVEYIYNNIYSNIYVNDIAERLQMNPSYLSKMFKDETGISLKEYIHKEKIKEAKNLMRYTSMSYTEIATQLGYSDLSHFTKVCKKYTKCTPKYLKEQLMQI